MKEENYWGRRPKIDLKNLINIAQDDYIWLIRDEIAYNCLNKIYMTWE